MEGYIVIGCTILVALVGAAVARPGGPDPQKPEDAPRVIAENGCGLFVVVLLALLAIGAVLAL